MRKFVKTFSLLICAVIMACLITLSACSSTPYITDIVKNSADGAESYTVYYSDGTSKTYDINADSEAEPYVTGISKTGSDGLQDIYTIYFSDGSTKTFTITNGSDGVTAQDLYAEYIKSSGEDISYAEFLKLYMTVNEDGDAMSVSYCLLSSMKVYTEFIETSSSFPANFGGVSDTAIYTGGAVIYDMDESADGYTYIVTNYHVVYDSSANATLNGGTKIARKIYGYLYGSEGAPEATGGKDSNGYTAYDYGEYAIELEYVGGSVSKDLAVLKAKTQDILQINENAAAVTLASEYYVGQTAIAIGNPGGDGISVTKGVVSVDSEYITLDIDGTSREYRSVRIDTPLYSGNSGGGLFNSQGQLIGICNAGSSSEENINYAIPLDIVTGTVESIIYYDCDGEENTSGAYGADLGVEVSASNSKYVYNASTGYGAIEEDLIVEEVKSGSVSETLGISVGDKIIGININEQTTFFSRTYNLTDIMLTLREGDNVRFIYERNGEEYTSAAYTLKISDFSAVE